MEIKVDAAIKLTQLKVSDSKSIYEVINTQREYFEKWLPFIKFTNKVEDSESFVNSIVNAPKDRFEYVFTIIKNDTFVGLIGFKNTDRINKKTEIGYWLSEKYQKQGIVTKSVKALCDYAFKKQEMNRVQIKCAVGNNASSNIPKHLGFIFEGIERHGEQHSNGVFFDLEIYSKLKNDK